MHTRPSTHFPLLFTPMPSTQAVPGDKALRTRVLSFLHRMVESLGPHLLPSLPSAVRSLLPADAQAPALTDVLALLHQLAVRYKAALEPLMSEVRLALIDGCPQTLRAPQGLAEISLQSMPMSWQLTGSELLTSWGQGSVKNACGLHAGLSPGMAAWVPQADMKSGFWMCLVRMLFTSRLALDVVASKVRPYAGHAISPTSCTRMRLRLLAQHQAVQAFPKAVGRFGELLPTGWDWSAAKGGAMGATEGSTSEEAREFAEAQKGLYSLMGALVQNSLGHVLLKVLSLPHKCCAVLCCALLAGDWAGCPEGCLQGWVIMFAAAAPPSPQPLPSMFQKSAKRNQRGNQQAMHKRLLTSTSCNA